MGKFSDTKYIKTIDNLVESSKDKIKNPYYIFSDKKPTKVTYYNQNIELSTLDESTGLYGAHVGKDSPFKFNKINNFLLYGIERISVQLDVGDFGTESAPINGNAIILPNTVVPRPGDFFSISYLKEKALFKIISVTHDTLDTGANIYNLEYSLELADAIDTIENQVAKSFEFIVTNVGTDFKTLIQSEDYKLINEIERLIEDLIVRFSNTFFDPRLQTFIFNHEGYKMYDPFLIEFFRRNNVLSFGDEYVYVDHAMATNRTFAMDYQKTIFYNLENPDYDLNCKVIASADMIQDPNSLFSTRLDDYYWINYVNRSFVIGSQIYIFDMDIIEHIRNNIEYERGNTKEVYNIWIRYFNRKNDYINGDLLSKIRCMDSMDNLNYFYTLAITIYILEQYVKGSLIK